MYPRLALSGGLKEPGNCNRLLTSGLLGDLTGDPGEGPEQQLGWNRCAGELGDSCAVASLKPQVMAEDNHNKAILQLQKIKSLGLGNVPHFP